MEHTVSQQCGSAWRGGHCSDRTMNMWWGYSPWALPKPLRDSYPQPRKLLFFLSCLELWEVIKATEPVLLWSDLIWPELLGFNGVEEEELKKTWTTQGSVEQGREGDLCQTVGFSSWEAWYLWIFWHPLKLCPLPKCSKWPLKRTNLGWKSFPISISLITKTQWIEYQAVLDTLRLIDAGRI